MEVPPAPEPAAGPPKAVEDVLYSDIGINTLLNRLKQSIASARDFAAFLKKRSTLEEEQAMGLRRLAKTHLETIRRPEVRLGSFAQQLVEVLHVHERMSENGMQFALSLHQMHEDLNDLSNNMERGRKQWKHDGLDAEKRSSDAEQAMLKAKAKYDSFAESYDRARTGDSRGSRRIGLKGPKSAEQHEQDLYSKVQVADADYEEKVRQAKGQREHLFNTGRPQAVKALRELIRECDAGLTLQLQKYATFNEKLLLGNGLTVSPLTGNETAGAQKSLRELISDIDDDDDFHAHVASFSNRVSRPIDISYEKHPSLAPKQQQPPPSNVPVNATVPPTFATITSSQPSSMNNRQPAQQTQTAIKTPPTAFTSTFNSSPQYAPTTADALPQQRSQDLPYHPHKTSSMDHGYQAYSPAGTSRDGPPAPYNGLPSGHSTASAPPSQPSGPPAISHSLHPVFGISLEDLFNRDQSPVPMIVYQCMQAVELFGLDVEGIYRLSGTTSLVNQLRQAFNNSSPNAPNLDFRNPANFYHDVNSVATLLKQFFRDLPDPLFTRAAYSQFIEAAKLEDEQSRRDALHQLINDLPDPNYATMRALVLHLHRVVQHEARNRMGASNLAICFA